MGIVKVDGRDFLDSGTVVVSGDAAVEIVLKRRDGSTHQVALKFRTLENEEFDVRFGNPNKDRTVIHFVNFPKSETLAADFIHVGKIGRDDLRLSYVIQNFLFAEPTNIWSLTYTLYGVTKNG